MSAKLEAASELKKFAKNFKSILALAEELEYMGSVEQAIQEVNLAHKEASAQCELKKSELSELDEKILKAKNAAAIIIEEAECKFDALIHQAEVQAINTQAAVKSQSEAEIEKLKQEISKAECELSTKLEALSSLNQELLVKEKALADVKQELEALKSRL